eukprot:GILK01004497.1.p1 GENE.GILK01004497.1~~GILK01004497.1.p1  ORF type:complete len:1128 (-),score=222.57 GILK01004497.1:290-3673(-)
MTLLACFSGNKKRNTSKGKGSDDGLHPVMPKAAWSLREHPKTRWSFGKKKDTAVMPIININIKKRSSTSTSEEIEETLRATLLDRKSKQKADGSPTIKFGKTVRPSLENLNLTAIANGLNSAKGQPGLNSSFSKHKSKSDVSSGAVEEIRALYASFVGRTEDEVADDVENMSVDERYQWTKRMVLRFSQAFKLLDLNTNLAACDDVATSIDILNSRAAEMLNCEHVNFYFFDKEKRELLGRSLPLESPNDSADADPTLLVAQSGKSLNMTFPSSSPFTYASDSDLSLRTTLGSMNSLVDTSIDENEVLSLGPKQIRSLLTAPLFDVNGNVLGVVEAINKRMVGSGDLSLPPPFQTEDENLISSICCQAGVHLCNNLLYEHEVSTLVKTQGLLQISKALTTQVNLQALLRVIMKEVRTLLDADRCTIFLLDSGKCELWSVVAHGAEEWTRFTAGSAEIRINAKTGIAGFVAQTGMVVNQPNVYSDPRFNPEVDKRTGYVTRNMLCAPLKSSAGAVIGVMQVVNKRPQRSPSTAKLSSSDLKKSMSVSSSENGFTKDDEEFLQAVASSVVVAIENVQWFNQILEMRSRLETTLNSISSYVFTLDRNKQLISANKPMGKLIMKDEAYTRREQISKWLPADIVRHIERVYDRIESSVHIQEYVWKTPVDTYYMDIKINPLKADPSSDFSNGIEHSPLMDRKTVAEDGRPHILLPESNTGSEFGSAPSSSTASSGAKKQGKGIPGVVVIIEDVTRKNRLMSTLSNYVSPTVIQHLMDTGQDRTLGGVRQQVTILFADIRDYTHFAEGQEPQEVFNTLNHYFSYMVDAIMEEGGVVNKYIGDALMALFGVPLPGPDDAVAACRAALKMRESLRKLNEERLAQGKQALEIGIGIATGEVFCGNIGSAHRYEYTVVGDAVNLASRLESATKPYGVTTLMDEPTIRLVSSHCFTREIDTIRVSGKDQPSTLYELISRRVEEVPDTNIEAFNLYARGLREYRSRELLAALNLFKKAMNLYEDGPSKLFCQRCEYLISKPPPAHWDGVWDMEKASIWTFRSQRPNTVMDSSNHHHALSPAPMDAPYSPRRPMAPAHFSKSTNDLAAFRKMRRKDSIIIDERNKHEHPFKGIHDTEGSG